MAPKIDPNIARALSLDTSKTTITTHGDSSFANWKGKDSEIMFAGEHFSLNSIHNAVATLCPRSYAHGLLADGSGSFLATDFLDLSSGSSSKGSGLSLAQKLVKLHTTPASVPEGYDRPVFGFPVTTYCGDTQQDNRYKSGWADFCANNRLLHILSLAEKNNGLDKQLSELVKRIACHVVPRLLEDGHLKASGGGNIQPVVVHGDLWSGNHGTGTIGNGGVEEVVFDPGSFWAHSEFEFGIMRMFGGFGRNFEREYHKLKPKDEPVEEWEDRVLLYELYHHLNHFSIFGGSYKRGAVSIMEELVKKYT